MEVQRERESTLVDAFSRVMEAGQRVLLDRVALALSEARRSVSDLLRSTAVGAIAVLFFLLPGWLLVLALAVRWLSTRWSLEASLLILAFSQCAIGVALVAWATRRRARTESEVS